MPVSPQMDWPMARLARQFAEATHLGGEIGRARVLQSPPEVAPKGVSDEPSAGGRSWRLDTRGHMTVPLVRWNADRKVLTASGNKGPSTVGRVPDTARSWLSLHRVRRAAAVLIAGALVGWGSTAGAQSASARAFGGAISDVLTIGDRVFVAGSFLGASVSADITGDVAIVDAVTGTKTGPPSRRFTRANPLGSDGEGGYYFATEGGVGHMKADGTSSGTPGLNGGFALVMVRVGSTLYVGGSWTGILLPGGPPILVDQPFLAAFDADTLQLLPWRPRVNGVINALHAANGVLYVGGQFTNASNSQGQPVLNRSNVAAFDIASGTLTAWNPATNGSVRQLASAGGTVFLAGGFNQVGGQARRYVAAVDAGGALLAWNPSVLDEVRDLVVTGSTVVLGGPLAQVGAQSRTGLAAVDATSGALLPWAPQPDGGVVSLAVNGNTVYTCGDFTRLAGQPRAGCASFDFAAGPRLQPWNPSMNGPVTDVIVSGNRVVLTGGFTAMNAVVRSGLTAIDPTTGAMFDWQAHSAIRSVFALASDGTRLFVSTISSAGLQVLDAVDVATGARPSGWTPQAVAPTTLAATNGALLLGTITSGRVEVRDPATGAFVSLLAAIDGFVNEIVVAGDTVYLGGGFTTVNGSPRRNLAALSLSSGVVLPLSVSVSESVRAVAVRGSTLFIGGNFSSVNGSPRNKLAAIDVTSGTLLPWAPSPSGTVLDLVASDDRLYVGGFFSTLNGRAQHGLAVFDATGVLLPYSVNLEGDLVSTLDVSERSIVVGGSFYYGSTDVWTNVAVLANSGGAPRNLAATVTGNRVRLTWEPPPGVDATTTYVLEAGGSAGTTLVTVPLGPELSFTADVPNGTFFVRVRANVAGALGPASNEVVLTTPNCGTIAAPAGMTGSAASGVVTLGWSSVAGASGYLLEAGTGPGLSNIAVVPMGLATALQAQVPPGTYYLRVRATSGCATSGPSNEVAVTVVGPAPPGAPILNAPQVTEQTVQLTWSPGGGGAPTSYLLVAAASPGGAAIVSVPLGGTSAAFANVPFGTYYLRLHASNAVGTSASSDEVVLQVSPRGRVVVDQPDDVSGPQIKVMYVLPSDATDRLLDVNGTLTRSVGAFQGWLRRESGGQQFKMDTRNGQLDITMVRLTLTDAQVMSGGVRQRDLLERELTRLGFNLAGKIYAVYYEGGHQSTCGDGFLPPGFPGSVVAFYLHGTPPGARPCDTNPFASSEASPGYVEFGMAHELFHGMGFVASCAPNHSGGHVTDDPSDLMYAGSQPWTPSRLDTNRDDYFAHGRACADAAQSAYLTR